MPKVEINSAFCKGCKFCLQACAKGVLKVGDDTNAMGYRYIVADKPEACVGCKLCAVACPDAAIEVYR